MKKTRFEKVMVATTTRAMKEQSLDTFEDHLNYTLLSIQFELLKIGKNQTAPKMTKPGKRKRDQVLSILGKIKSGLIWTGSAIKKSLKFVGTGNNAVYVIMGAIFAYAIIIMILEMF